jgi:two-component sensor histidine kinase
MTADGETARIAELEEDNRRLRRLLDQRDAPGELRHRLRSTLGLLRSIIRRSAVTERERSDYAAHMEDRLEAIARAQAVADQHGEIDLHDLVADELLQDGLVISGPPVRLKPKAGQVLALALHELAVNAVEHGSLGVGQVRLEITWAVEDAPAGDPVLTFTWREFGSPSEAAVRTEGFGTEVLTRMLPYELHAQTSLFFGSQSIECRIALPLRDSTGRVGST